MAAGCQKESEARLGGPGKGPAVAFLTKSVYYEG